MRKAIYITLLTAIVNINGRCTKEIDPSELSYLNSISQQMSELPKLDEIDLQSNNCEILLRFAESGYEVDDRLFIEMLTTHDIRFIDEYYYTQKDTWANEYEGGTQINRMRFSADGEYNVASIPFLFDWYDMVNYMTSLGYHGYYCTYEWQYHTDTNEFITGGNTEDCAYIRYMCGDYVVVEGRIKGKSIFEKELYLCKFVEQTQEINNGILAFDEYKAIWEQYCKDNNLSNENNEYYWW